MFTKNWALMAFSCILFTSSPIRGENVQRDDNAGLEPRAVFDEPLPSSAICEIATALCAACPPSVTTQPPITITSTATVTFSNCFLPMATVTVTSCPFETITKTVTEGFSIPTTTSTTPSPVSSSATPTPSSSIRPSSSSVRPSSNPSTIRSSTPLSSGFSSTIPPRTTVSTTSRITTTAETARTSGTRGPLGIVRREMMANNITALVTNTTRSSTNATASLTLNLTGITTTTTSTTTTTGAFPRFHHVRYQN